MMSQRANTNFDILRKLAFTNKMIPQYFYSYIFLARVDIYKVGLLNALLEMVVPVGFLSFQCTNTKMFFIQKNVHVQRFLQ